MHCIFVSNLLHILVVLLVFILSVNAEAITLSVFQRPCNTMAAGYASPKLLTADPREMLLRQHIWGNVMFPQINIAVRLRILQFYLTQPISAVEVVREPSHDEIDTLAKAMDHAHSGCKVSRRSERHSGQISEELIVPRSRLQMLLIGPGQHLFADNTILFTWRTFFKLHFGQQSLEQWENRTRLKIINDSLAPSFRYVDEVATLLDISTDDRMLDTITVDLMSLGQEIKMVFESEEVRAASSKYIEAIRSQNLEKRSEYEREAAAKIRNSLKLRILQKWPKLSIETINQMVDAIAAT